MQCGVQPTDTYVTDTHQCPLPCRYNAYFQLGQLTNANQQSPVEVLGGKFKWRMISAGQYHSCGLLDGYGIRCWVSTGH